MILSLLGVSPRVYAKGAELCTKACEGRALIPLILLLRLQETREAMILSLWQVRGLMLLVVKVRMARGAFGEQLWRALSSSCTWLPAMVQP